MRTRVGRFGWATIAIVVLTVAVRLLLVVGLDRDTKLVGDAIVFHQSAANLAAGDGLSNLGSDGELQPLTEHPPLFPVMLAAMDVVGAESPFSHQVALAVLAGAGVGVVALLGRRLGSPRIGLVAAAVAAIHPRWIEPVSAVFSESLVLVLVPTFLFCAVGVHQRPTVRRAIVAGIAGGALILTRSESTLLVAVTVVTLVVVDRRPVRARFAPAGVMVVAVLLLLVPWMARNRAEVGSFTVSTNLGITLSGAYCDETFAPGPRFGAWELRCAYEGIKDGAATTDGSAPSQAALDRAGRTHAIDHARDHVGELPMVAVARVQRLWSLGHNADQLTFDVAESGHLRLQRFGRYLHWLLLPLALLGAVALPRRAWRTWVLVALPAITVTLSSAVVYGSPRMRAVAEPTIALFAAASLVWAWSRVTGRPSLAEEMDLVPVSDSPAGGDPPGPPPTEGGRRQRGSLGGP